MWYRSLVANDGGGNSNHLHTMNPILNHVSSNPAVKFSSLAIGDQFVSAAGGVIRTKIAKGKSAFPNSHSGKVFVTPENWNTKVVPLTEHQATLFRGK